MEREFNLAEMSREALDALRQKVDSELEARAFEARMRQELQSHMNRQEWINSHHDAQRRRR